MISYNDIVYLIEPDESTQLNHNIYDFDTIPHLIYKAPAYVQFNIKDLIKS